MALREFPPLLLAGLRIVIAGTFILPIYLWRQRGKHEAWTWPEFRRVLLLGLFGVAGNQLLFVIGLAWTSVAHAAIVVTLMPVLVLLFSAFLRHEHTTPRKILGMITAAAGVAVLQLAKDPGSGATLLGDFCIFLAILAFAIFTVKGKQIATKYSSLTVNTIAYAGGGLALAPMTLWLGLKFDFGRVSAAAWWSLIYMAVFAAVIAYLIYYYALTYIPASRVSAFSYLQPMVATLFAVLLLGDRITTALVIGGILVLSGVYVTERA
jgi:drug/metabolite transporter (DMT)-like permease